LSASDNWRIASTVMSALPKPRQSAFDQYWRFASERQRIFAQRVSGAPKPWTEDKTLQHYKFCNVFRASDRVSQFMIGEVIYHGEPCSPADRIFQIVAFRTFSRIATWRSLRASLGRTPTLEDLRSGAFAKALEEARRRNGGLYTGAFILCATRAYGHAEKHLNHVALFRHMFLEARADETILAARSLADVYSIIHAFPLMGDFMAYQIAIDLNYSELLRFDENDFTMPGPGALRGIKKVFEDLGGMTPAKAVMWMVERQDEEFERLGVPAARLWGRRLHAIDCQGLFCEVDKYCREAMPELRSARTRIKATFKESSEPLRLFFPPRWGINQWLPKAPVLGFGFQPRV
jgi:hypothetical protein